MFKYLFLFLFFFVFVSKLFSVEGVTTSGVAIYEDGQFKKRVSSMSFSGSVSIATQSSGVQISITGSGGGFDSFRSSAEAAIDSYYLFLSTAEPFLDGLSFSTQVFNIQINNLNSSTISLQSQLDGITAGVVTLPLPSGATNYLQRFSTGTIYLLPTSTASVSAIYFQDGSTLTTGFQFVRLPLPQNATNYLQNYSTGTTYYLRQSSFAIPAIYWLDGTTQTTAYTPFRLPLPQNATNYIQNYSTGIAYYIQNSTFVPFAVNLGTVAGSSRLNVAGDIFVEGKIQNSRFDNVTYPFVYSSASLALGNINFNETLELAMFRHELSNNMTWSFVASSRAWYGIAMNIDGKYRTATENGGQIWISSSNGVYWENVESNRNWYDCAVSLGGKVQAAIVSGGQIYMSYDGGKSWVARDSNRGWNWVAISEDGKYVTAGVNGGQIYTSNNYGFSFTARDSNRNWSGGGMSGNGQYQTACVTSGQIYRSSDWGVSWTAVESSRVWNDVRVSYSGQYQIAVVLGGNIYVSNDFGVSWTAKDTNRLWYSCAISMNGKYQAAAASPDYVYLSFDNGNSWTASGSTGTRLNVAISGDGRNVASTLSAYYIAAATASDVYSTGDDSVIIQNKNMLGIGIRPSANLQVYNSSPTSPVMTVQILGRGVNVDTYKAQLSSNAWYQTNFISAARSTLFDSVVGFKFKVRTPMTVTHLGSAFNNLFFVHDSGVRDVSLYDATNQAELARLSITTNATVDNSVYFSTLPAPIQLSSGSSYALFMYLPINFYVGTSLSTTTSLFLSDFENRSVASSTMTYTESSTIFSAITLGPNMKFNAYGTTTTFTILSNVTQVNNNFLVSNGSSVLLGNVGIGTTTPSALFHIGTGTSSFVFTNNANIGVGVTTPSAKLHMLGGGIVAEAFGTRADFESRSYDGTILAPSAKSAGLLGVVGAKGFDGYTNLASQNFDAAVLFLGVDNFTPTSHGAAITFGTTKSGNVGREERMRISTGGFVGIGTDTPLGLLHVRSNGAVYSGATSTPTAIFSDSSNRATVRFRSETDSPLDVAFDNNNALRWDISARGSANQYNFQLYNQAASPSYNGVGSAVITVKQDGKVGIGIGSDTPGYPLHVVSTNGFTSRITSSQSFGVIQQYEASATGGKIYEFHSTANGAGEGAGKFLLTDRTAAVTRIAVSSTGNVGIGTTAPAAALDAKGHIISRNSSNNKVLETLGTNETYLYDDGSLYMRFTQSGGSYMQTYQSNMFLTGSAAADMSNFGVYADAVNISDGGTSRFAINTSGNVGIGTTSPATKLAIIGHGTTAAGANAVIDATDGGLRRSTSSRRYKRDIQTLITDFSKILQAIPRSFLDIEPVKQYFSTSTYYEIGKSTDFFIYEEKNIKQNLFDVDVPTITKNENGEDVQTTIKEVRVSTYAVTVTTLSIPADNPFIEFSTTPAQTGYGKGKMWVLDKRKAKRYMGYIAEEFDALGLNDLVVYDEFGRPDAIEYSNIPIYLLEVMKDQKIALENQESYRAHEIEERSILENRIFAVENNLNLLNGQNLNSRLQTAETTIANLYTELQNIKASQSFLIDFYNDLNTRLTALEKNASPGTVTP